MSNILQTLGIISIIVILFSLQIADADAWWNSNWTYCINFDSNFSMIDFNISDIVLPVFLNNNTGAFNMSYNWADIRFVNQSCNDTGGATMPYQTEFLNSSMGIFHVNFTELDNATDTKYSVYFGNPAAISQSDNPNPYSASYVGVFHMNQAGKDSSIYNFTGTSSGNVTSSSGIIDGAEYFNSGYYDFGDNPAHDGNRSITVMAWIKFNSASISTIAAKVSNSPKCGWELIQIGGALYFEITLYGGTQLTNTLFGIQNGYWIHVAATYDGNNMSIYYNGNPATSTIFPDGTIDKCTGVNLTIGAGPDDTDGMIGYMDDVIILNRTMNASEIKAIYNAGGSNLFSLEAINRYYLPPTSPTITVYYPSHATVLGDVTQLNVSADMLVDTWQYVMMPGGCPYITFTPNTTINITYLRGLGCFISDHIDPWQILEIFANNFVGTGYHWDIYSIDSVYPVISDLVPATTAYITSSSPSVMITGSVLDWWSGTNHTWVNDSRWVNIGTPYTIQFNNTNASIGYYTVLVSANDSAGNEISTPMSFYVAYTSPPIPVVPSSDIPLATRLLLSTIMASGGIISFVGFSLYGKRDLRQLTYGMVFLLIALTFAATIMTM
jgi:hypothetical protein